MADSAHIQFSMASVSSMIRAHFYIWPSLLRTYEHTICSSLVSLQCPLPALPPLPSRDPRCNHGSSVHHPLRSTDASVPEIRQHIGWQKSQAATIGRLGCCQRKQRLAREKNTGEGQSPRRDKNEAVSGRQKITIPRATQKGRPGPAISRY